MAIDLSALGLGGPEIDLYLLLLDREAATTEDLAREWCLDGHPLETVLRLLQTKGLVTSLAGPPVRVAAVDPDVALDNLARVREQEIAVAREQATELADRWRRVRRETVPAELVEVVVGREATLQRSEQIQRSATREVLLIDAPPYATTDLGNPLEVELLGKGKVGYRCLYDRSSLDVPGYLETIRSLVDLGEEARVGAGLPLKMVMGDDTVAMLPLETAPASITAAVVVHPSALLTSLQLMFEALWHTAYSVRGAQDRDAGGAESEVLGTELADADRQVIQLLVTGLTDQAIARQLGVAERTIQRRVHAIMRTLRVDNRLQLGLHLAQQGWGTR